MRKISCGMLSIFLIVSLLLMADPALGWHDKTHLAISQAAGYESWYNSAAPDVTKTKADMVEKTNHWFNNNSGLTITEKTVLDQTKRYNDPKDEEGHLYGAIIASLRDYKEMKQSNKYAQYPFAFCAHYIGDLSMPLHNTPYNDFNLNNHTRNDGIVEFSVLNNIGLIQKNMYEIEIHSENDLAREIARIANLSRTLGLKLEKENRDMTKDEAYNQLFHSASLLKAVIAYSKENN